MKLNCTSSSNGCKRASAHIARRGELNFAPPIGYIRRPSGEIAFDPDEQVQQVVRLVFRKFEELGTLNGVLRYLVRHDIQLGVRVRVGRNKGDLEWHRPNRMTLQNLLKNPAYAGAYAYGRRQIDPCCATTRTTENGSCGECPRGLARTDPRLFPCLHFQRSSINRI